MELIKKICGKVTGNDKLKNEIKELRKEIRERDLLLKRIKMVATSNHYGYTKQDKEYREKHCINMKLRKIFELACEFDEEEIIDLWDELEELEEM